MVAQMCNFVHLAFFDIVGDVLSAEYFHREISTGSCSRLSPNLSNTAFWMAERAFSRSA